MAALKSTKRPQRRCNRTSAWRLAVVTLALIVFGRFDGLGRFNFSNRALDQGQRHARAPSEASESVLLASAAYLDSIGQFTNVLSEFVNSLLEKVSFLAEIIIESSLNEECSSPIEWQSSSEAFGASCANYATKHNLTSSAVRSERYLELTRDKFDEREFKNVGVFIESLEVKRLAEESEQGAGQPYQAGCKIFSLDISQHDLPVDDMTICCNQFGACYNQCKQAKLTCDQEFRQCLTRICKQNFDYKNETLVQLNRGRLTKRDLLEDQYEPLADIDGASAAGRRGRARRGVASEVEPDVAPELLTSEDELERDAAQAFGDTKTTIKRLRDKYKACKLASKLLIIGNLAFGCLNYRQSQWRACCQPAAATAA